MKRIACFCFLAVLAAADTGTSVRPGPSDYDTHQTIKDAAIAASLLSAAEAAKIFSAAVSRNFIVIEIAVYPENGSTFDLQAVDFALKIAADNRVYALTPEEVAWHGRKPPDPQSNASLGAVQVTGGAGVGFGSQTNPATGRTTHGVYTYEGVGVTNRPQPASPPQSGSADSTYVLEGRLRGLQLQEGRTARPVAGYLYYPAVKKPRKAPLLLEYSRSGERALLTLPVR